MWTLLMFFLLSDLAQVPDLPGSDAVLYATLKEPLSCEALSPCLKVDRGDGNGLELLLSRKTARLRDVSQQGGRRESAVWPLTGRTGPTRTLQLRCVGNKIRVVVDGRIAGETEDLGAAGAGKLSPGEGWTLLDARVQPLGEISFSDDFMRTEKELGEWEAFRGSWKILAMDHPDLSASAFTLNAESGKDPSILLTGYPFWDDEAFQSSVKIEQGEGSAGLLFDWRDPKNYFGVRWGTDHAARGGGNLSLIQVREGRETVLAEKKGAMPREGWFSLTVATQRGKAVVGVDGIPVLSGEDPAMIGGRIGLWAEGISAQFDDVEVRSLAADQTPEGCLDFTDRTHPWIPEKFVADSYMQSWAAESGPWQVAYLPGAQIVDDTFHQAPVDWIPGSGRWKVVSRWVCLPKFSWLGGQGDGGLVAFWHRWHFEGDHAAEAFLGNGMSGRPLPHYNLGVNRCLTICGDGQDPLSGYSLTWGGPDFPTRFARRGVLIAESNALVDPNLRDTCDQITTALHRNWPCLRLEKEGAVVRALLDGTLLFTYQDPVPIEGGQVCLWSWERPLMVARARIAYGKAVRPSFEEMTRKTETPEGRHGFHVNPKRGALKVALVSKPFEALTKPRLSLDILPQQDASLHLLVETESATYAGILCGTDDPKMTCVPLKVDPVPLDGQWHRVQVNLLDQLRSSRPDLSPWRIKSISIEDVAGGSKIVPWMGAKPAGGWLGVRDIHLSRRQGSDRERSLSPPILRMSPDPRLCWSDFEDGFDGWTPYGALDSATPFLLSHDSDRGGLFLRAINMNLGGCMGMYAWTRPYDLSKYPWIAFDERMGPGTNINLLLSVDGVWEETILTGVGHDRDPIAPVAGVALDEEWHRCFVNAYAGYMAAYKPARGPVVQAVAFGDTGLWSHVAGNRYDLDGFEILSEISPSQELTITPESDWAHSFQAELIKVSTQEKTVLAPDSAGTFLLKGLSPEHYRLEVSGLDSEGQPAGPKAVTDLFVRAPVEDVNPATLSNLLPAPESTVGHKRISFTLSDAGSGVDLSSVRLQVGRDTYTLESGELQVDSATGHWVWDGHERPEKISSGPVSCSLSYADVAGNPGSFQWQWTFDPALDQEGPEIEQVSLIPFPHFVHQDFEDGPDGWEDFDNAVVDWGRHRGVWDDHAIQYNQNGVAGMFAAFMNIRNFNVKEWPLLSMDVCISAGKGLTVFARVHNTDWPLSFGPDIQPGRWQRVVLDLEEALKKTEVEDLESPVEFLIFQLHKPGSLLIDNVCLYGRDPGSCLVRWPPAKDATGIAGYRYKVDKDPQGSAEGGVKVSEPVAVVSLNDESLFLHLQAQDKAGHWGPLCHRPLMATEKSAPPAPRKEKPAKKPIKPAPNKQKPKEDKPKTQ